MFILSTFLPLIAIVCWFLFQTRLHLNVNNDTEILQQTQELIDAGRFVEAVQLCESANLEQTEQKPSVQAFFAQTQGIALLKLGCSLHQSAPLEKAVERLKYAVAIWKQLNWEARKALTLNELSRALLYLAYFEKKSSYLEQALGLVTQAFKSPALKKNLPLFISVHVTFGMICYSLYQAQNQDDYLDKAFEFFQSVLTYCTQQPASEDSALAHLYLSLCYQEFYWRQKNPAYLTKAMNFAELAKPCLLFKRDPLSYGMLWFNIGKIHYTQAPTATDNRRAFLCTFRAFHKVKKLYTAENYFQQYIEICIALGKIYQFFSQLNPKQHHLLRALHWITNALNRLSIETNPQQYLDCFLTQGALYARLADLDSNRELLTNALQIYTQSLTFTLVKLPYETLAQINLEIGLLSYKMAGFEAPEANLETAIEALETAIRTNRFPSEHEAAKAEQYLVNAINKLQRLPVTEKNYLLLAQAYQRLIQLYPAADYQETFAQYQTKLSGIYRQAASFADTLPNYQLALSHLEQAEAAYRNLHVSKKQAVIVADMAQIYLEMARLENSESHLEKALRLFNHAYQIYTTLKQNKEQSLIQIRLGTVYRLLSRKQNRLNNLTKSLRALECAFNSLNSQEEPQEFLGVLIELGLTHRASVEYTEPNYHINKAAFYFKRALEFPLPDSQKDYIKIKNEYAQSLMHLADYCHTMQNLTTAIELFASLQEHFQNHQLLEDYILLQNHLALCYQKLSEVSLSQKKDYLLLAIRILEESLKYLNAEQPSQDYAMTQNNLGIAYSRLALISDRENHIKKARIAFEQALPLYEPETFPEEHQKVKVNLEKLHKLAR